MIDNIMVFILGALPISEVRGAIPYGMAKGMELAKVLPLAIAGNILPVIPALFLFEPISAYLRKFKGFKGFFDWLTERTKRSSGLIEKYEAVGLMLFVAVPLPVTGAWTGCVAATLFKIRFRYAFLAIAFGVVIAAAIVTAVCLTGKGILYHVFTSGH